MSATATSTPTSIFSNPVLGSSSSSTPTNTAVQPTWTNRRGGGFGATGPSSFYRNLFYILVGLLGFFILISAFSWWRGRQRRQASIAEARRLGLLIPGMPGYAAERERLILSFRGIASTTENPEVWDALGKPRGGLAGAMGMEKRGDNGWEVGRYEPEQGEKQVLWDQEFRPLAITPLTHKGDGPIPVSPMKWFPNAVAFRAPGAKKTPEAILQEWETSALTAGDGISSAQSYPPVISGTGRTRGSRSLSVPTPVTGTAASPQVQVAVLIRMPIPSMSNVGRTDRTTEEEEESAVQEEWEGVEMGLCNAQVDLLGSPRV